MKVNNKRRKRRGDKEIRNEWWIRIEKGKEKKSEKKRKKG